MSVSIVRLSDSVNFIMRQTKPFRFPRMDLTRIIHEDVGNVRQKLGWNLFAAAGRSP